MITDTEDENSTRNDEKSDDDEDEESDKSDKSDKTKSSDESSEKTNTESTKSGSESDAESDVESSEKESPRTPFNIEKAERENRELQEQVAQLKRRMDELNKMEVKVENNKSKMFLAVQRQRDKLLKEAHESEVELDDLKEELNEWTKKNKDIERESKENQSSFKKDKKMLEMAIQELQNRVDRADDVSFRQYR
jgi:chromosome segregation ATPase